METALVENKPTIRVVSHVLQYTFGQYRGSPDTPENDTPERRALADARHVGSPERLHPSKQWR